MGEFSALSLVVTTVVTGHEHDPVFPSSITASSELGRSLLSLARRINNDDNNNGVDYTWITNYSLKFQGCHSHTALNLEADNENDVIIKTVKLAHFRLCPTNSCQTWLGGGCSSNYADYVIDLETFAKSYIQSQRRAREYQCQLYMLNSCDCQENDDRDDGWKREYCEYDCFSNSKLYKDCSDRNPYQEEDGEQQRRFEPERYMECKEWERNEGGNNNNNNGDDDGDQTQYYIGPYCSAKGGEVYLGLYTDDSCTNFADTNSGRNTYKSLAGTDLPYAATSLISSDCVSCIEVEDLNRRQDEAQDDAYGDDAEDADEVSEQCERLYQSSGKCEMSLSSNSGVESPNSNACSYIGGIQFTKVNGVVVKKMGAGEKANVFIGLFATMFVGMAAIVYKLRKNIDAKGSPLLEKDDSQEDKPFA
ncbi:hypothetical protein HJC23_012506 [Cyclotella cryptica]|uniref:Uncharacterized protein n=1 Tax=Cyclotella cryptica TaxID=29204 RepID=A0ABD3QQF0_9STRA